MSIVTQKTEKNNLRGCGELLKPRYNLLCLYDAFYHNLLLCFLSYSSVIGDVFCLYDRIIQKVSQSRMIVEMHNCALREWCFFSSQSVIFYIADITWTTILKAFLMSIVKEKIEKTNLQGFGELQKPWYILLCLLCFLSELFCVCIL